MNFHYFNGTQIKNENVSNFLQITDFPNFRIKPQSLIYIANVSLIMCQELSGLKKHIAFSHQDFIVSQNNNIEKYKIF
jgi:hypothetical protein